MTLSFFFRGKRGGGVGISRIRTGKESSLQQTGTREDTQHTRQAEHSTSFISLLLVPFFNSFLFTFFSRYWRWWPKG